MWYSRTSRPRIKYDPTLGGGEEETEDENLFYKDGGVG